MASLSQILAQATPNVLLSYPGFTAPVRCRVKGTVAGGSGAVTVDTDKTTIGCSVARVGTAQYQVTFPACRDITDVNIQVYAPAPETQASSALAQIDADEAQTLASLGTLKFHTFNRDDGDDDTELGNGHVFDINFTLSAR